MITEMLAKIVVDTDYESLPDEVVDKAKQCFTDFLAVSLGGSEIKEWKNSTKSFHQWRSFNSFKL